MQGAAELCRSRRRRTSPPVPWLLGWEVAEWPRGAAQGARGRAARRRRARRSRLSCWRALPGARTLALSLAPPVIAGYLLERPIEQRLGGPGALAGGLLAGAAALALAEPALPRPRCAGPRASATRWRSGSRRRRRSPPACRAPARRSPRRGRSGSRGLTRLRCRSASRAPCWQARRRSRRWRLARRRASAAERRVAAAGALSAFAGTRLAVRVLGVERRAPLWPWAAERALLAGAILAVRYRRPR